MVDRDTELALNTTVSESGIDLAALDPAVKRTTTRVVVVGGG